MAEQRDESGRTCAHRHYWRADRQPTGCSARSKGSSGRAAAAGGNRRAATARRLRTASRVPFRAEYTLSAALALAEQAQFAWHTTVAHLWAFLSAESACRSCVRATHESAVLQSRRAALTSCAAPALRQMCLGRFPCFRHEDGEVNRTRSNFRCLSGVRENPSGAATSAGRRNRLARRKCLQSCPLALQLVSVQHLIPAKRQSPSTPARLLEKDLQLARAASPPPLAPTVDQLQAGRSLTCKPSIQVGWN